MLATRLVVHLLNNINYSISFVSQPAGHICCDWIGPICKLSPKVLFSFFPEENKSIRTACLMQWSDTVVKNSASVCVFFLSPFYSPLLSSPPPHSVTGIKRQCERAIIQTGGCVWFALRHFTDSDSLSAIHTVFLWPFLCFFSVLIVF